MVAFDLSVSQQYLLIYDILCIVQYVYHYHLNLVEKTLRLELEHFQVIYLSLVSQHLLVLLMLTVVQVLIMFRLEYRVIMKLILFLEI